MNINLSRLLSAAIFSVTAITLAACGNTDRPAVADPLAGNHSNLTRAQTETQAQCDAVRVSLRRKFFGEWQVETVAMAARVVSHQFTSDDIDDMKSLVPVAEAWGEDYARQDPARSAQYDAAVALGKIVNGAIDRSGLKRNPGVKLADDFGYYFLGFGFSKSTTNLPYSFTIADIHRKDTPAALAIGVVRSVSLLATPDQSRYYLQLVRNTEQKGSTTIGEYMSLSQYVKSQLPEYCASANSALNEDRFNSIAGI